MNWLRKQISKELWSPYVAGVLLGLVGISTVVFASKLLGASGGFENIAGMLGKAVAPAAFNNTYFNFVMPAQVTYAVMLLVGIFFGGMLGALSSGTFKLRTMDDAQWKTAYGPQLWKRWLLLFVGAHHPGVSRPASPAAAPAAWPSPAACCSRRRPSCSSPACSPRAS